MHAAPEGPDATRAKGREKAGEAGRRAREVRGRRQGGLRSAKPGQKRRRGRGTRTPVGTEERLGLCALRPSVYIIYRYPRVGAGGWGGRPPVPTDTDGRGRAALGPTPPPRAPARPTRGHVCILRRGAGTKGRSAFARPCHDMSRQPRRPTRGSRSPAPLRVDAAPLNANEAARVPAPAPADCVKTSAGPFWGAVRPSAGPRGHPPPQRPPVTHPTARQAP